MNTITIDGIEISNIMLGAGARGKTDDESVFKIMDRYIELGGNCFDGARKYADGEADKAMGRWLKSRGVRDRVRVCAKGGFPADTEAMHISRLSPAEIERDLDDALRDMGIEQTDFYLLHRDDPKLPVEAIMPALDALVRKGKTRAIGCSNWTVARIAAANAFAKQNGLRSLSVCQLHYSLLQTTAAQTGDVTHVPMNDVEACWYRETRFPLMGFGVQGRGYFAQLAAHAPMKDSSKRYYDFFPENHRRAERLERLAMEYGVPRAAVATAYVLGAGLNAAALCSFSSIEQLEEAWLARSLKLDESAIRYLEMG